jgi:hypothetical protein
MALQSSGPISANNINVELGRAGTAAFSINGAEERALAEVASGLIDFQDFYGKSASSGTTYSLDWMASSYFYSDITVLEEDFYNRILVNADGTMYWVKSYGNTTTPSTYIGNWATPTTAGIGANFQFQISVTGNTEDYYGSTTSTTNWYGLDYGCSFGLTEWDAKYSSLNVTFKIREDTTPFTVVASKSTQLILYLNE